MAPIVDRCRAPLTAATEAGLGGVPVSRRWLHLSHGERLALSVAAAVSRRLGGLLYVIDTPLSALSGLLAAAVERGLRHLVGRPAS